jgi:hypothetical protein
MKSSEVSTENLIMPAPTRSVTHAQKQLTKSKTAVKKKAPMSSQSFPLQKLPLELRTKIWEDTLPGPRIVEIDVDLSFVRGKESCTYTSKTTIPKLLHVHRESREIGRKHYQLSFGCKEDRRYRGARTIWVSFKLDTFYFMEVKAFDQYGPTTVCNTSHLENLFENAEMRKNIVRLAFPIKYAENDIAASCLMFPCAELPKLADVILVGDEIKSSRLNGSQERAKTDPKRRRFVDPGQFAASSWAAHAARLRQEFQSQYDDLLRERDIPQPAVSVKLLVKG